MTPASAMCPTSLPAPSPLPRTEPKHRTLAYWLERTPDLDETLLDVDRIRDMNASLAVERGDDWHGENDLVTPIDRATWPTATAERLASQHKKLLAGELVEVDGTPVPPGDIAQFDPARAKTVNVAPELRVALAAVPIRCGPRVVGFYSKPAAGAPNTRFDRNNCSTAHPQEVVQILGTWPNGMKMARTRYATGWISADAKLSPPIPDGLREAFVNGPRVQADQDLALQATHGAAQCPAGTLLPLTTGSGSETRVHFASATGFHESAVAADRVQPTQRPLTRRALLAEAFRFIDTSYGWGGGNTAGGHDCSGFMMDLFAAFDLHLPRHSSWQARAGTFSIDTSKVTSDTERTRLIDAAAKKGAVLLSFPGHVMLYLGRTEAGTPMVLHAIAEYAQACPGGGETLYQIDKINVSDLELGRGSSRKALLERITRITVIGKPPGVELVGAAEMRPAAPVAWPGKSKGKKDTCKDSDDFAIFQSPRRPNTKQPMRLIASANADPGAAELVLFDPAGNRVTPTSVVKLAGGPPWSIIATVDKPVAGEWTAVLGDGSRVDACERIAVATRHPGASGSRKPDAPAWDIRRTWGRASENLYSTFVQRLFDFPPDQDVTWPNLHVLLKDPSRNILFDHLQNKEEEILKLQPDCADLPYLLRSYFAWKMGMPFAFHECSRGNATHPPICKKQFTNLMIRDFLDDKRVKPEDLEDTGGVAIPDEPLPDPEETDGIEEELVGDVRAFELFWGRQVSWTVHAASGRTVPDAEDTDYYPVPLSREWLKPGVAYHDPFGHVMVIAGWVPQSATSYGMLLAADAQPDGTVGRKRFWRGNFLFTTETRVAGAGFKAFRPVFPSKGELAGMKNAELKRSRAFAPFSRQQYEGTVDTFHDTMEALINPRPLDPSAALAVLVDSLHSQAKLRIVSVKNGEDWAAANPGKVMPMPDGADIFLTSEVLWEDFATPSRDFRLLIAIDTVMGFPASVKRTPARFGLDAAAVDKAVARVEQELDKALRARTIEYIKSDGKPQVVTLRELVDRRAGFEISYNPNDCAEVRWAAVEGSAEYATCQRRAPNVQIAKMATYRTWFHDRRRPVK